MQRPLSQIKIEGPSDSRPLVFRIFLVAALLSAFAQVTLGAFVRVTDAGLACGSDWPLCGGQWVPVFTTEVILEYAHRLTAVLLGIFILIALAYAWKIHRDKQTVFRATLAAFLLVLAAGAFGGATVISELGWGLRLIHLAIAEALIAALVFALVAAWPVKDPPFNQPSTAVIAAGGTTIRLMMAATFAVLISGSVVVGLEASSVCGSWPFCSGTTIFPPGDSIYAIHMGHRMVAAVAGVLILGTAVWTWRMREWWPGSGPAAIVLGMVLLVQIVMGAAVPWSAFAPGWKALHVSVATATWVAASVLSALVCVRRLSHTPEPDASEDRFRELENLVQ